MSVPNPHVSSLRCREWFLLGLVAVWVGGCAFAARAMAIDDAFTGLVCIKNLLAGQGFTFVAGQPPVEGVTNTGWLLLLAPWCLFAEPLLVAKVAGGVILFAAFVVTMGVARRLARDAANTGNDVPGLVLVPVVLLMLSFEFVYFPLAGMETGLLSLLLMMMAARAMNRSFSAALPCLGALAFLTHPEAALVYPAYWLMRCAAGRQSNSMSSLGKAANAVVVSKRRCGEESRRRKPIGLALYAALLLVLTALRWLYFGDVVPNTFHAKPSSVTGIVEGGYRFLFGQNSNIAFPITGWLSLPVLLLGYLRLRRSTPAGADMLAAIGATGLVFAIYSPADWTELPRYFAPYLPAALILLWAGVNEIAALVFDRQAQWTAAARGRVVTLALLVVAAILATGSFVAARAKIDRLDEFPGYVIAGVDLAPPAVWMREHLPRGATIATRRIGALAYFSERPVFDYAYGLPDREVAKLVARNGGRFDSPASPALLTVWQAKRPDYLLEDGPILDYIVQQAGGTRERFSIHGIEYRVIREFPLGKATCWTLAERLNP